MTLSRRRWLQGMGAGALLPALAPFQQGEDAAGAAVQAAINRLVGQRNIGVAVARLSRDGDDVQTRYRVGVNTDALRPTASCFKAWLPLYYYTFTPQDEWDDGPGTLPYTVVVNSNNVNTGRLLREVGQRQNFGNDIEKFNDFLLYGLRLEHGLNAWNWPNNPVIGFRDERFASGGERVVRSGGEVHTIGNVTTADDTLNGYRELFRRSFSQAEDTYDPSPQRRLGALRTMRLLALPSDADYESPIERIFGRGVYIGKDGILPEGNTTAGRVVNDAGLIPMREGMLAIAFFAVRESEFSALEILRGVLQAAFDVEARL